MLWPGPKYQKVSALYIYYIKSLYRGLLIISAGGSSSISCSSGPSLYRLSSASLSPMSHSLPPRNGNLRAVAHRRGAERRAAPAAPVVRPVFAPHTAGGARRHAPAASLMPASWSAANASPRAAAQVIDLIAGRVSKSARIQERCSCWRFPRPPRVR